MINLLTSSKSQITGDRSVIFLKFERVTASPNLKIDFCNLHPKKIFYIYVKFTKVQNSHIQSKFTMEENFSRNGKYCA